MRQKSPKIWFPSRYLIKYIKYIKYINMKKYKITQDRDLCMGCGRCTMICPENWEMNEKDYKSQCKKEVIEEQEYPNNQMASEECPVQCIKIEEIKE